MKHGRDILKGDHLSILGARLTELQEDDFVKCVDFYRNLEVEEAIFLGENKALMKTAHNIAFTLIVLFKKISAAPVWAIPYLRQLKSDTVQLLPSIVFGGKRALHLFERASIEDLFRYIYFFDHKIEHILLQKYPKKFQSFNSLVDWAKDHPSLSLNSETTTQCFDEIASQYAELSRTIHGTTVADQQLLESLQATGKPIAEVEQENRRMKSLYKNIFFLLLLFHLEEYRKLQLDERTLICRCLSKSQIGVLSGLTTH